MRSMIGSARLFIAAALFCVTAFGQQMTVMTPTVSTFTVEGTLPLTSIGFNGTPSVPANVLASIQGGALEIRQSLQWAATSIQPAGTNYTLRVRHFLVAPGSPNPTPMAMQTTVIEDYTANVTSMVQTANPPALALIGMVTQITVPGPFGNQSGRSLIVSFGYDASTPVRFNNLTLVIPGNMTTYIQTATGTLTFGGTTPSQPSPGDPVVTSGTRITTAVSEITLDATKISSDPGGGTLTYSWRVVTGSANLIGPQTATPRAQLAGNAGEYVFELTVTNSRGRSATGTVTVIYTGFF